MRTMQRVARSVAISVSILAGLAISSVAAAGGFGQGAGTFAFSDTFAFDSFYNSVDQSSVNISVDRGLFMYRPRAGGPLQMQHMTSLSVTIFGPQIDPTQPPQMVASGCFILPDSDFVVSSDLQTASVNATLGEGDVCPGFLVPVVGATPIKAAGGGAGGGGTIGLSFPLTVSATWTGTGATSTQTDQGRFSCGTFNALTHSTGLSAFSSAVTASISGYGDFSGGQPLDFGNVNQQNMQMQVAGTGILSAACGGQG